MNTIPEALEDVDRAFRHLEFAIRLMCYCEQDHLDLDQFDTDVSVVLEPTISAPLRWGPLSTDWRSMPVGAGSIP